MFALLFYTLIVLTDFIDLKDFIQLIQYQPFKSCARHEFREIIMEEKRKVLYTKEPHYDAGLFDNSSEEWKQQKTQHEGLLLDWSNETKIGDNGQLEVVPVGLIEDPKTHKVLSIPYNRIQFI